ncbi:hypothetical protein Tco_1438073, partial [Tanacetum coccineum]
VTDAKDDLPAVDEPDRSTADVDLEALTGRDGYILGGKAAGLSQRESSVSVNRSWYYNSYSETFIYLQQYKVQKHVGQINVLDAKGIKACKVSGLGCRPTNPIGRPETLLVVSERKGSNNTTFGIKIRRKLKKKEHAESYQIQKKTRNKQEGKKKETLSPFLTRQTKDVEGIEREEKNARNVVVDKIENIYVEQRKEEILEEKIWCGRSVGTTQESNNNESRNKGLLVSVEENQKQRFVCFDVTENQKAKDWHEGSQDVLGELPPVIGIAMLLGLAQENQEAVKECYKEYIGMAKRYYEGAKRTKQEKPEVVVGKGSGTAGIKRPQAVADVIAEIGDSLDGTQGRIAQDDAKVEGSNSVWTTDNNGEEYTSRFIEDIKASRTKKLRKEDFGITTLGRNCWTD